MKEAVELLARGEVREAIGNLNSRGRVVEIKDREERIAEIAREYVRSPERTLVVSPVEKKLGSDGELIPGIAEE